MTANANAELFEGGPLLHWEQARGLVKPGRPIAAKHTLLAVLIGWVPLAVLAGIQFLISTDESAKTFFTDIAVHVRFLIAVPALIFAKADCIPRLQGIVNHFGKTDLVVESDQPRFQAAVSSTRRLLDSKIIGAVKLVLVYLVVAALAFYFSTADLAAWHRRGSSGLRLSPAGCWYALVSLPLLLIVLVGWVWRLALWIRFLFLMSRLDLRLIPSHPDGAGGLKFVSSSLRGFRLISFSLGAIVAGTLANHQFHQGLQPFEFRYPIIGVMVFLAILFAGPLVIFTKKLRATKKGGVLEYGALTRYVGTEFEAKWLRPKGSVDETSLEAQDFSATTDLYSVADKVYAMRDVPFTLKDLIGPIGVSAMLPFLPVALLALPLEVVLRGLVKLLV